jgi:hypothetical protein
MTYDTITFPFQVHNDAVDTETAYLSPEHLPFGTKLEVTPASADIAPDTAVVFQCTLTIDEQVIRPGCDNDQGFLLTAWRVAHDADERWGSCFYWLRPRVRTRIELIRGQWYAGHYSVYGFLALDTDQNVTLSGQLPLTVRLRVEVDDGGVPEVRWHVVSVQQGGGFNLVLDLDGPAGAVARAQAWFDRTDLLASARSNVRESTHLVAPQVG